MAAFTAGRFYLFRGVLLSFPGVVIPAEVAREAGRVSVQNEDFLLIVLCLVHASPHPPLCLVSPGHDFLVLFLQKLFFLCPKEGEKALF